MNRVTWRHAVGVGLTSLVIVGGVWLAQGGPGGATDRDGAEGPNPVVVDGDAAAPTVGELAADFTGTSIDGQPVVLSAWRGRPVWLVFQATWCPYCRAETPDVAALAAEFAGRVEVVSVYVGETAETVRDYAGRLALSHHQVPDPAQRIAAQYRVEGLPGHVFVDAQGVIQAIRAGVLSSTEVRDVLDALL